MRRELFGASLLVLPLALLAFATALVDQGAVTNTVINFFVSLIAVVGIGIYSGSSGIVSFGHTAFMALGAYAAAFLTIAPQAKAALLPGLPALVAELQLGLPHAIGLAVLATALVAGLVGFVIARLEGAAASIATLGLLVIVYNLIVAAREVTRGSQALYGIPLHVGVWTAFLLAAATVILARLYRGSRAGLELRAAREDDAAARAVGIAVPQRRWLAWVLSAAVLAVAGALYGHFLGVITPRAFYFHLTFALLAMLIVGGMASVTGAVAGTALVTAVIELLRRLEEGFRIGELQVPPVFGLTVVGLSVMILLVMYRRRAGLFGFREIEDLLVAPALPAPSSGFALPRTAAAGALVGEGLAKDFGGLRAVDDVSFRLQPGEILGLIGPNGAGKSTLLALVSGILAPSAGTVRLDGTAIAGWTPARIARHGLGRTFQNIRLFRALSVLENVRVASHRSGLPAADLLARFGLLELAHRPAGTLAYGPQRRLEIARAVALKPRYLLLDEPAAGMNQTESDALMQSLQALRTETGIGLMIIDHDLRLIMRLCDRVMVMDRGRVIAEGPPAAVQRDPAVIEAYLGRRSAAAESRSAQQLTTEEAPQ